MKYLFFISCMMLAGCIMEAAVMPANPPIAVPVNPPIAVPLNPPVAVPADFGVVVLPRFEDLEVVESRHAECKHGDNACIARAVKQNCRYYLCNGARGPQTQLLKSCREDGKITYQWLWMDPLSKFHEGSAYFTTSESKFNSNIARHGCVTVAPGDMVKLPVYGGPTWQ